MPRLILFDNNNVGFEEGADYSTHPAFVGYISYDIEDEKKDEKTSVIIGYLEVNANKQGQGYGKILLNLMLLDLHGMKEDIGVICLDDCSDCALTRDSIYFTQGFRIHDDRDHAQMSMILGNVQLPLPPFNYIDKPKRNLPLSQPPFKGIPDVILQNVSKTVRDKIDVKKAQELLRSIMNETSSCKRITRSMNTKNTTISKKPRAM